MRIPFTHSAGAILGFGLALALAACTGAGSYTVSRTHPYSSDDPTRILRYLAQGPDVRTVVIGSPGNAPQAATDDAVTRIMNARASGPDVNYTTRPENQAGDGYSVVVALGGEPVDSYALCRAADSGPPVDVQGRPSVQTAFCYRGKSLSQAYVQIASLSGPDDPNLKTAVLAAMSRMFPVQVPSDNGGNCGGFPEC